MMRNISLDGRFIEYRLKVSRRGRTMRLAVHRGGDLVVTAPWFLGISKVENFMREKSRWIFEKIGMMKKYSHPSQISKNSRREYLKYKEQALGLASEKILEFNKIYNFRYSKISIRNQKTRWGSCSKKGNLSFNYKIVHLDERSVDYIIVHELCHLGQFNHSKRFWDLVAVAIPDYKVIRKKIRNIF